MSALLFPTSDALRLALASGVIPPAVACGPVAAGRGDGGELWLTPSVPLPPDLLAALARFGVRSQAPPPGFHPAPFPCWAAPLPLRMDPVPTSSPTLVRLPAARLAGFVAAVQRFRPQPVKFVPDRPDSLALLPHPPAHLLDRPDVTVYHEAAPAVWVRGGWQHPLPAGLEVPTGSVAFVDPPADWQLKPIPQFLDPAEVFPLAVRPPVPSLALRASFPTVLVPVKLRTHPTDAAETLWAFDGPPEQLTDLFRTTDERVLSRFLFAVVEAAGVKRVWAVPVGRGRSPVLPPPFRGFVPHPSVAGVFLPTGKALAPSPRPDRMAEVLKVDRKQLVCVDLPQVYRLSLAAFRPLADLLEYTAPARQVLSAWAGTDSRLSFAEVRVIDAIERPLPPPPVHAPPLAVPAAQPGVSWIGRLADKLLGGKKPAEKPRAVVAKGKRSSRIITPAARRPPPDRDARRRVLEQAVLDRQGGAAVWAELAGVNVDAGKRADAALCWVNALWEADPPPAGWVGEWVRAERRGKSDTRLAAAVVAEIGFSPDPHPDADRLPYLVRLIDTRENELPVRAVWLARLGAARAAGGDPLSLARCRDRLLARLAADGPSLELDAPAFLRFHGSIDGDRFREARDWLLHVRESVHKWLHALSTCYLLGEAGLDPDPRPTVAYADLMLAWGLSRLGEGSRADELVRAAEGVLRRAGGHGVDPAVHATLLTRFRTRIRDAQHGRRGHPAGGEPGATELPADQLSAYAVAKLAERSRVLSPYAAANPYRGLDLDPLRGTDPLARRLNDLLRESSAEGVAKVLADTATDPTAGVLPRVILTVVELPVAFPTRTADRLMLLLPRTVELLPEAVRLAAADPHTDPRAYLQRLVNRTVHAACRLAVRYDLNGGFGAFVRFLLDATTAGDSVVKAAVEAHLPDLFAALRKLGLLDLAGELAGAWADKPIGWFVMGRDEAGWALLDAARERLFVTGIADDRGRTAAAFEYVAALTHAPPRLALGRLEELFQRLGRVTTAGATARYFALTPLELLDRAVSAVVTDEFNLGPAVRRWLDDDEFLIRRRIARDLDAALAAGG